jgi:hypothetical protein
MRPEKEAIQNDPKISPKYRVSSYLALNLHVDKNDNWDKATEIFHDRI